MVVTRFSHYRLICGARTVYLPRQTIIKARNQIKGSLLKRKDRVVIYNVRLFSKI